MKRGDFQSAASMWAALAVIVLWLAAILAYAYEDGMNLFELMGQFSRHLEYPFAIGWKPHTPKFMAVALLLYAMGIAMYYSTRENRRPGRSTALRNGAMRGSCVASTRMWIQT